MKKALIILLLFCLVFMVLMSLNPYNSLDAEIAVPTEAQLEYIQNSGITQDLYRHEIRQIAENDLTYLKPLSSVETIISDYEASLLQESSYHFETDEEIDVDMKGYLFQNSSGEYEVMVTITRPYSFQLGESDTSILYYLYFDYTPYYYLVTGYSEMYLQFPNGREFYMSMYSLNSEMNLLPENTYHHYFQYPQIVTTYYFTFRPHPSIDSSYFALKLLLIQSNFNDTTIQLGFNVFTYQPYYTYLANTWFVEIREEN